MNTAHTFVLYPAAFTVHTPSGQTHACERHTGQLRCLMAFMGAHVAIVPAPAGAQCKNCINAAKDGAK